MTLLTICQDVAAEVGFPKPTVIVNNTDETAQQLYALAKKEARVLTRHDRWEEMIQEASFDTVAGTADYELQTIAPGFSYMINDTEWNRSERRRLSGPVSPAEWQRDQTYLSASIYKDYRIRDNKMWIYPTPQEVQTYYFEFMSVYWCQSQTGTPQSQWLADTDTSLIDEALMEMGLLWRFLKAKGLDYGEEKMTYDREVQKAIGRSGAAPTLSINGRANYRFGYPAGGLGGNV